MKEPIWITKGECLSFHQELVARFGGVSDLRDEGLLDSALARPQQAFAYGEPTLAELASFYAEGIVKNHPFLDGNKRTGLLAAAFFLETNGQVFTATEEQAVLQTLALAAGEIGAQEYGIWLSANRKSR